MGALCSKESKPDPFAQPGRAVSSAPPTQTSVSVPKKVGGPARTLGASATSSTPLIADKGNEDARKRAAEAAEARAAAASKPKGKLGQQLQEQKKQTRSDTLEAASSDERRMRDADAAANARAYN